MILEIVEPGPRVIGGHEELVLPREGLYPTDLPTFVLAMS